MGNKAMLTLPQVLSKATIEEIRAANGVRTLRPIESNKKAEQLPAGVYGYITPWELDKAPGVSLQLDRLRGGTSVVEVSVQVVKT